jgi:hypothetical protein
MTLTQKLLVTAGISHGTAIRNAANATMTPRSIVTAGVIASVP